MPLSKLTRCIVPPNRLASVFSWHPPGVSSILGLIIRDHSIGVSITSYPSSNSAKSLDPIPFCIKRVGGHSTSRSSEIEKIQQIIKELTDQHNVCGYIIGWPLEMDGRPGMACGKVLHVLDALANHPCPQLYLGRPAALWDISRNTNAYFPTSSWSDNDGILDHFGRNPTFSRIPTQAFGSHVYNKADKKNSNSSKAAAQAMLSHYMSSFWEQEPSVKETKVKCKDESLRVANVVD